MSANGHTSAEDLAKLREKRAVLQDEIRARHLADRESELRDPEPHQVAAELRAIRDRIAVVEAFQDEQSKRIDRAGRVVKELVKLVNKIDEFLIRRFP